MAGVLVRGAEAPREVSVLEPPTTRLRPTTTGEPAVLLSGRLLTPAGKNVRTQSYSWGMAISPDETQAALISQGAIQFLSLNPLRVLDRVAPFANPLKQRSDDGMYMGVSFSPDGSKLYVSSANRGSIVILDTKTRQPTGTISINGDGFDDSFLGDFSVRSDGRLLYACDQFNYRLVTVDLDAGKVTQSVRVGRNPFGVCLSHDEQHAWVSNVGMFEYPLLPGVTATNRASAGLPFPAYGVPSKEAEQGVMIGGVRIPGLGSPNHPDAMSVFKVNLQNGKVEARIKTGYLVVRDARTSTLWVAPAPRPWPLAAGPLMSRTPRMTRSR